MLFNSYTYLLVFLPLVVWVFLRLGTAPVRWSFGFLVVASLVYYAWYSPVYLPLIVGSAIWNYYNGRYVAARSGTAAGRVGLTVGIALDLALLAWFKYAAFLAGSLEAASGIPIPVPHVALPLAISFFTFQQIAYLVDAYRGQTREYHFVDYMLFVTFFPQLIAGPIVHHAEMMPQFSRRPGHSGWERHLPVGLAILLIGLFKKVVVADNLARVATPLFGLAASGTTLGFTEAWVACVAYALQIYFDFSGYSDMAIGSARLFGIRLPLNFHSPYKATSIIEFWQRWHMTLSRFLRDYVYIPLGGNRRGRARRYANLMITMLLGGLWHGAGWNFVLWGGLHGGYLVIAHGWRSLGVAGRLGSAGRVVATGTTFVAATVAWAYFRADSLATGNAVVASMLGCNGLGVWSAGADAVVPWAKTWVVWPALVSVFVLPNTQEILRRYRPALDVSRLVPRFPNRAWQWRPSPRFALAMIVVTLVIGSQFDQVSEFIYYRF